MLELPSVMSKTGSHGRRVPGLSFHLLSVHYLYVLSLSLPTVSLTCSIVFISCHVVVWLPFQQACFQAVEKYVNIIIIPISGQLRNSPCEYPQFILSTSSITAHIIHPMQPHIIHCYNHQCRMKIWLFDIPFFGFSDMRQGLFDFLRGRRHVCLPAQLTCAADCHNHWDIHSVYKYIHCGDITHIFISLLYLLNDKI